MNIYNQFIEIVKKYPNHPAVTDDSHRTLNYVDFLNMVNQYADILDDIPNTCVAIYMPKKIEMIALQLAINSKSMAFMTLEYGQKARMMEATLSTKPSYMVKLDYTNNFINNTDGTNSTIPQFITFEKQHDFNTYPIDLGYIIFSSGSTGKPKQILMKDKPVINVVVQQAKITSFDSHSVFLWLLNSAFDASLSDIYMTLLSGGHLIISNQNSTQIKSCFELIEKYKVTHTDIPPVVFNLWLKKLKQLGIKNTSLKHIIFGGELAHEDITKELLSYVKMYNAYGPTETTICSSMIEVTKDWQYQNVGQPFDGVLYKIVDDELHIGGEHCSLGYSEEKLNEKFYYENEETITQQVSIKKDNHKVTKWFKTGDIFKEKDNNFFYIGRKDRQFKLNGQLICPEEIEHKAKQFGADNAHVVFDDKKIHLYFSGDFDINNFKDSIVSWMRPHFYCLIDIKENLNQNWKLSIKIDKN